MVGFACVLVTFRCAVLRSGNTAGILIKYGDLELWY